jgi:hypothetical protein
MVTAGFMVLNIKVYAGTIKKVKHDVAQSIDTRQNTQKKTEQWQDLKSDLTMRYDKLRYENEALNKTNKILIKEEKKHRVLNKSLREEKKENLRIQKEMLPFLMSVQEHLQTLIENDIPFLQTERKNRLNKLKKLMEDIDVTIAEKFRKVMEALLIEAEYGNTIEVYQEKVSLDGNQILGNVFRLGRISMFFLLFDKSKAAVFNVQENKWVSLDEQYIPAITSGVEMASKQRSVELISLPLGKIAKQ